MQNDMHGFMGGSGFMGGYGLWTIIGALLVVFLVVAIARMLKK